MRCHITSIFPEKSPQAKQLVKSDPGSIYRSKIHKLYDIEIAFQEGLPTKLVANSPNRYLIKSLGFTLIFYSTIFCFCI